MLTSPLFVPTNASSAPPLSFRSPSWPRTASQDRAPGFRLRGALPPSEVKGYPQLSALHCIRLCKLGDSPPLDLTPPTFARRQGFMNRHEAYA